MVHDTTKLWDTLRCSCMMHRIEGSAEGLSLNVDNVAGRLCIIMIIIAALFEKPNLSVQLV